MLVLLLSTLAAWEYRGLVLRKGGDPSSLGLFGGLLLLFYAQMTGAFSLEAAVALLLVANFALSAVRYNKGSSLANAGFAIAGVLYVSMFNYLVLLWQLEALRGNFALYGLFLTWATDIAAYFIGTKWGKTPLAPNLSPNKSREGAAAGLVGSGIVAAILGKLWFGWMPLAGAAIGLLVSFAAQLGDLTESAFKRDANVKDAGQILPGHGGILDRFDSLLFVAPVLYLTLGIFF